METRNPFSSLFGKSTKTTSVTTPERQAAHEVNRSTLGLPVTSVLLRESNTVKKEESKLTSFSGQLKEMKAIKLGGPTADHDALENALHLSNSHSTDQKSYMAGLRSPLNEKEMIYFPVVFDKNITDPTVVSMSALLRNHYRIAFSDYLTLPLVEVDEKKLLAIQTLDCEIIGPKGLVNSKKIKMDSLVSVIQSRLQHYPLSPGQCLYIPYRDQDTDIILEVKINAINENTMQAKELPANVFYRLEKDTEIELKVSPQVSNIALTGTPTSIKSLSLDFAVKGVGGHKNELAVLLRDIFYSRAMPVEYVKEYGIDHTKGILLFGPPGTGKTLIARTMAALLTDESRIKIVNGPELKNKYVGQGAQNLRDVFKEADAEWAEKNLESELHVIIFDELDSLCPERGSRTGTGADEDMIATLLTKTDGVKQQHNFIIMGTTNRKDLIDPALLRAGRLECHLEIGLPNEKDRLEILIIKTAKMRENDHLDVSVDMPYWAEQTKNYTGAELEELVKKAVHFAMGTNFGVTGEGNALAFKQDIKDKSQLAKVTQEHFTKAFAEIRPAFGIDEKIKEFTDNHFITYSPQIKRIEEQFQKAVALLKSRKDLSSYQLLISGPSGSGKTHLAAHLAEQTGIKYIKFITADQLLSRPPNKQLDYLDEQFKNANRAESSIIILDDLENFAELAQYNPGLRLKLESCLKSLEEAGNKCIVIATTQNPDIVKRMKLSTRFHESKILTPVLLEFSNPFVSRHIITHLCHALGYEMEVIRSLPETSQDQRKIELPIRELIYQIKKFAFEKDNQKTFDIDEFYSFLNPNQSQEQVLTLSGSYEEKMNVDTGSSMRRSFMG